MPRSKEVIALINNSAWKLEADGLNFSRIFESAQAKHFLPQLHSLYLDLKPSSSKLKANCHWSNLRNSFQEDLVTHSDLDQKLCVVYATYLSHFGKKYILVDELESSSLKSDIATIDFSKDLSWSLESSCLTDNESPDATTMPMRVVAARRLTNETTCFLIQEAVESFYYGTPAPGLLSEAGMQFQSSMRLKKRVVVSGFHKVIINSAFNLRVILIDPLTLVGDETAPDKAVSAVNAVRSLAAKPSKFDEKKKPVAFFPAIKRIYEDDTVGQAVGGYFYTSSGAKYTHNSKGTGSDLRKDPFQQGGEQASPESINFIKIAVEWAQEPGKPTVSLNGSAEMFERPDSLHSMEVLFSTKSGGSADFLEKPLDYGTWK